MYIGIRSKLLLVFISGVIMLLTSCAATSTSKTADARSDETETVRVMSYNIHHANPPANPDVIDIKGIAAVIRAENPDLVALQEVDVNTERSGEFNQASEIARQLNMHFFFAKAIDYQGGEYGVAILSKYPLKETKVHRLLSKSGTNGEPRILATALVELPGGTLLRFGSTHLDAQKDAANRQLQIDGIKEIAVGEKLPFIIAGDFNAVPESDIIRVLDSHFTRTCQDCPMTSSANNPVRTIDYVAFHHPQEKMSVKSHRVIKEKQASDHLPVVADISFLKK